MASDHGSDQGEEQWFVQVINALSVLSASDLSASFRLSFPACHGLPAPALPAMPGPLRGDARRSSSRSVTAQPSSGIGALGRWMAIGLACFVVITVLCCGAIYKWFSSKQEYKSYAPPGLPPPNPSPFPCTHAHMHRVHARAHARTCWCSLATPRLAPTMTVSVMPSTPHTRNRDIPAHAVELELPISSR